MCTQQGDRQTEREPMRVIISIPRGLLAGVDICKQGSSPLLTAKSLTNMCMKRQTDIKINISHVKFYQLQFTI